MRNAFIVLIAVTAPALSSESAPEVRENDRIVFVGDAFFERELTYGAIESTLTIALEGRNVTFRNLGWSGDDVHGRSRVGFDSPDTGLAKLTAQIQAESPSLAIVSYGMVSSFDGPAGLERFTRGADRLLDFIAGLGSRIAVISPVRHEALAAPLPDPSAHNADLRLYVDALRQAAKEHDAPFLDLFAASDPANDASPESRWTENGIHLTAAGYDRVAERILEWIGVPAITWSAVVRTSPGSVSGDGANIALYSASAHRVELELEPRRLPATPFRSGVLRVQGLAAGTYTVTVDGEAKLEASAAELFAGVTPGIEESTRSRIRDAIQRKNFLHFASWRPQNNTYLFLFRRHEQGDLAAEIDDFAPLIRAAEEEIARGTAATSHRVVIERSKNKKEEER